MKYIIGIDLGGTNVKMGLVSEKGAVKKRLIFKTLKTRDYKVLLKTIEDGIKELLSKIPKKDILGIGFGVPGFVNYDKGLVHKLVNIPGWRNIPLRKIINKNTKLRTFVDNDVNCMVLGEVAFGAGKGKENVVGITLGTGVGGGVVIEGKLYRGSSFTAGEVGHITLIKDGPKCNCGNNGCLEALVGNNYIISRVKKDIKKGQKTKIKGEITPKSLFCAARAGDKYAKSIWKETGEYIGIALSGVVNMLNPELIIIGGGVSKAGSLLIKSIRDTVRKRSVAVAKDIVKIKTSKLGNDAGVLGAAALVIDSIKR